MKELLLNLLVGAFSVSVVAALVAGMLYLGKNYPWTPALLAVPGLLVLINTLGQVIRDEVL